MFFAVWDFIFSRSSFKSVLPMAFTCAVQTSTGASRRANRAGLQLRRCRSPTRPPKLHKGPHRGEFWFSLQNELTPPPKGGGAGFCSILGCSSLLDSSTTASHGSNGAGLGSCWCPTPLPGSQICTQGRTGPSLVFACLLALLRRISLSFGNPV